MPSVRSRLVWAKSRAKCRMSGACGIAVSWCTITSGSASATASATASASSASATAGVAPSSSSSRRLDSLRVMPVTAWPRATSRGTSWRPSAPVAPATKIFMVVSFRVIALGDEMGRRGVTSAWRGGRAGRARGPVQNRIRLRNR